MLDSIGRMLFALWANDFSQLFSIVIASYFVFALLLINSTNTKIRALVSSAPGAMTSLGILGTFVGIFLGLLDFDIRTINRSVPLLLEGLKVAFGTSILGLLAAISFRLISPAFTRESISREDASAKDIVDKLIQLDASINKAAEANSAGFENLRNALTDDKDSSIVGQLQRLRTNVGDLESTTRHGFEAQITEFKKFAEHMSEAFSKAIIEELQAVIREFNETLSEQFGENFKQLNVAVGRLVDWQDEYRQQMSELKIALDNAVEGIQASQKALGDIEVSASKLPDHLTKMEQANSALNSQLEKIEESLGGFAEMRDKAIHAFPEIEKNIEDITVNLSSTVEHQTGVVKEIAANCESLVSLQKESNEKLLQGFEELRSTTSETTLSLQSDVDQISKKLVSELSTAGQDLHAEVVKISKELSVSITDTSTGITEHLETAIADQKIVQREMLEGLQTSFNETISNATNRMIETIAQLDEAMQGEIESVIRAMAENLSGITEKFVADYTPLLKATRRIVEIGERANRNEQ